MLCYAIMCVSAGQWHDMCETMGGSVTVFADFADRVVDPSTAGGQGKVMPVMESAEVYSVHTWQ